MGHTIETLVEFLFGVGLFLNAALFIPQAIRLIKKKSAVGVSLFTFLGFNLMQLLTIVHGFFKQDYLLMVGFTLSFITCAWVSFLIWNYQK